MSKFTYWNSQNYRTLTHWQNGKPSNYITIQGGHFSSLIYWNPDDTGEATDYSRVGVPLPGGVKTPGSSYALNGQWFSEQFNYENLKLTTGGIIHCDTTGKTCYIGRYYYDTNKLLSIPIEYSGDDTMQFYQGHEKYYTETSDTLKNFACIPTLTRYGVTFFWIADGYDSMLPSWVNLSKFSENYNNSYLFDNGSPWDEYVASPYGPPANISNGLSLAIINLFDSNDYKIKVPRTFSGLTFNQLETTTPGYITFDETAETIDGGNYGGFYGFYNANPAIIQNPFNSVEVPDENAVTLEGATTLYSGGTYTNITSSTGKPISYEFTGSNISSNYKSIYTRGIGIAPERYVSGSTTDGTEYYCLRSAISKRYYNSDGEQVGAFYFTLVPIIDKIDIEEITLMQRSK